MCTRINLLSSPLDPSPQTLLLDVRHDTGEEGLVTKGEVQVSRRDREAHHSADGHEK
jgi:hypothetical protein